MYTLPGGHYCPVQTDKVLDGDGGQGKVKRSLLLLVLGHVVLQSGLQITPLLQ